MDEVHDVEEEDKLRVLVVDDEIHYTSIMGTVLETYGFEVQIAHHGTQALAHLYKNPADLILLDVMMPEMDGLTLLRHLRSDPDLSKTPIIVVSAKAEPGDRSAALSAGADNFLPKPFTAQELRAVLKQFLPIV